MQEHLRPIVPSTLRCSAISVSKYRNLAGVGGEVVHAMRYTTTLDRPRDPYELRSLLSLHLLRRTPTLRAFVEINILLFTEQVLHQTKDTYLL